MLSSLTRDNIPTYPLLLRYSVTWPRKGQLINPFELFWRKGQTHWNLPFGFCCIGFILSLSHLRWGLCRFGGLFYPFSNLFHRATVMSKDFYFLDGGGQFPSELVKPITFRNQQPFLNLPFAFLSLTPIT